MKRIFSLLLVLLFVAGISAQSVGMSPFGYGKDVTGGGNATPTLVSTASELYNAMGGSKASTTAKVIILTKSITVSDKTSLTFKQSSNKTIMALPGVTITTTGQTGDSSGAMYFRNCSNIILRNLTFIGPGAYDCDGEDLLCLDGVTNAWVDHCDFQDGCDDNFDIKSTSDNITVSWCRFHYLKPNKTGGSGGSNDHRFSNLLGSNSSDKPSDGTYNLTWAYCWWDNGCVERMLRCRNASLHFLNCYWNSDVANYYIGPENTDAYVEGCTFAGGSSSTMQKKSGRIFYQNYGGTNGVKFVNSVSTVTNNTTLSDVTNRMVTTPSYSYTALSADAAVDSVTSTNCGAGATLKVSTDGIVTGGCDGGEVTNKYTVTFNANGHGTAPASIKVVENTTISAPTAPTASGYTFGGWYKETACTNAWNFSSDIVTGDTTLYAKWTASSDTTVCYSLLEAPTLPSGITITVNGDAPIYDATNGITLSGNNDYLCFDVSGMGSTIISAKISLKTGSQDAGKGFIYGTDCAANFSGTEVLNTEKTVTEYTLSDLNSAVLSIRRKGTSVSVSDICLTLPSGGTTCTDPSLSYATTEMEVTMGDSAFTNPLTNSNSLAITYSSGNTAVATVSTSGKVTLKGVGQTTITATAAEQMVSGTLYCEKAVSYNLTVNEPTPTPQSGYEIKFTEAAAAGSLNGQTLGTDFTLGITDTGSKIAVDANSALFGTSAADTVRYAYRLKTGGKSSSKNCMTLTIPVDGTLYIYARTGSNSATDRNIVVTNSTGTEVINHILLESDTLDTRIGNSRVYLPVSASVTAGTYDITYPTASVNIYGFKLLYNTPTAVKQTQTQVQVQVEKFIINGQLYIRREGKVYDSTGKLIPIL